MTTLKYSKSAFVVGFLTLPLFLLVTYFSHVAHLRGNPNATWWTTLGFVCFSFSALWLLAECFWTKLEYSELGIQSRTILRKSELKWTEVKSVEIPMHGQWFVITSQKGAKVRVSFSLSGLGGFASQLLKKVPATSMDRRFRALLDNTAGRNEPNLHS
jgi:hypothetical protein